MGEVDGNLAELSPEAFVFADDLGRFEISFGFDIGRWFTVATRARFLVPEELA